MSGFKKKSNQKILKIIVPILILSIVLIVKLEMKYVSGIKNIDDCLQVSSDYGTSETKLAMVTQINATIRNKCSNTKKINNLQIKKFKSSEYVEIPLSYENVEVNIILEPDEKQTLLLKTIDETKDQFKNYYYTVVFVK